MWKFLIFIIFCCCTLSATALDNRIVGGYPVDISEFPHQISMIYNGTHRCGGSIIGNSGRTVLTAAHCTNELSAGTLQVRYGSTLKTQGGEIIQVKEIRQHENYTAWLFDFDLAILKLEKPIKFSTNAKPIELNHIKMNGGETVTVSGWGALSEGGKKPDNLHAVTIQIVDNPTCASLYGAVHITDRMLCAGFIDGGKDSCSGDSGGPLIKNGKLVGVVSWGAGCARPKYPGIYSSVHYVLDWIEQNMKD